MAKWEEEDAIDEAIARSNMEKVGLAILRLAENNRPVIDHAACLMAVKQAREDKTRSKTSRKGTIEALRGTLVNTPATGNCLYMATAEVLLQRAFAATKNREVLLEITMLVKFLLYLANRVDADVEFVQSNTGAFLEIPEEALVGLTREQQVQKVNEHYAQVATSSSELNHTLPQTLWGHTDSIRLLAKGLRRCIYVISPISDAHVVHHLMFQPQRIQDRKTRMTIPSSTVHQLGYQDWLAEIQTELEAGVTPLVLSYTTNHYNAVLLHHDTDMTDRKIPTKTQTLTELWGAALPQQHKQSKSAGGDMVSMDTEAGPTREQLIDSQSSIHAPAIFRALSQENWTRPEKQAAIEALVFGQDRLKELLVFCGGSSEPAESQGDGENAGTQDDSTMSSGDDSAYTPPPGTPVSPAFVRETDDDEMNGGQGETGTTAPRPLLTARDDEMNGIGRSSGSSSHSVYMLPNPLPAAVYTEWAQIAWGRNAAEWAGQHGITPPRLEEQRALAQFAVKYPDVMAELGRQHPNPFVILDHFKDEGIKNWCLGKRVRYCLDELTHVIARIDDAAARHVLTDWLVDLRAVPLPKDVVKRYRDSTKWSLLKAHAAAQLKQRPLLTMNYTRECAYVLVIDELFPTLAREIFAVEGVEHEETVSLIEVYEQRGPFTAG